MAVGPLVHRDPEAALPPDPIRVRALLFGVYGEMSGARELRLSLPTGSRVADLVRSLRKTPGLDLPEQPVVAVNQVYAGPEVELSDGDEVALIPPVAGG